jgi:DNA repair protein RecO (recombination protein O)
MKKGRRINILHLAEAVGKNRRGLYIKDALSYHCPMERNTREEGIILRTVRSGEYHKMLTLLTPDEGLLRATAFGAYKSRSKLSGATEPFTEGTFYLYRNPVKEQVKVTDVAARRYHEAVRGNLERLYTASFWAELVIKSYAGGGEYAKLFRFFSRALGYLDTAPEAELELLRIQFFWRYIEFMGLMPALEVCAGCGRGMEPDEAMYLREDELVCADCAPVHARLLDPSARAYLKASAGQPFDRARELAPEPMVVHRLLAFSYGYAESVVGTTLNTLKRGVT